MFLLFKFPEKTSPVIFKNKVFAHRSGVNAPENSFIGLKIAQQQGFEGIELDVQMTKDSILVLLHDETIDRTTKKKGHINQISFKKIKETPLNQIQEPLNRIEYIPALKDILIWASQHDFLIELDLKAEIPHKKLAVLQLKQWFEQYELYDKIFVSTHHITFLYFFKKFAPEITLAYPLFKSSGLKIIPNQLIFHQLLPHFFEPSIIEPHWSICDETMIKYWRKKGKILNTWIVNIPKDKKYCQTWKVSFITDTLN